MECDWKLIAEMFQECPNLPRKKTLIHARGFHGVTDEDDGIPLA